MLSNTVYLARWVELTPDFINFYQKPDEELAASRRTIANEDIRECALRAVSDKNSSDMVLVLKLFDPATPIHKRSQAQSASLRMHAPAAVDWSRCVRSSIRDVCLQHHGHKASEWSNNEEDLRRRRRLQSSLLRRFKP